MPNRGGFSWKRALGVTQAKQRISRKTGIPLTKSGRQRKFGAGILRGCGCSTLGFTSLLVLLVVITNFFL